jgi:hypothetical protein
MRIWVLAAAVLFSLAGCGALGATDVRPAPDFPHQQAADWLNSAPLTMQELRGKVLVLDVWTFG